jgi:hypothetical protein
LCEKIGFFSKTIVMIKVLKNSALVWVKSANFLGENIFKIIPSVPDLLTLLSSARHAEEVEVRRPFVGQRPRFAPKRVGPRFWRETQGQSAGGQETFRAAHVAALHGLGKEDQGFQLKQVRILWFSVSNQNPYFLGQQPLAPLLLLSWPFFR